MTREIISQKSEHPTAFLTQLDVEYIDNIFTEGFGESTNGDIQGEKYDNYSGKVDWLGNDSNYCGEANPVFRSRKNLVDIEANFENFAHLQGITNPACNEQTK